MKLQAKQFKRNYPLRLAVLGVLALAAIVMVLMGNSPWDGLHSESYRDGEDWAKIIYANGNLVPDTCAGMSPTLREFDVSEFQDGCRNWAASVGVEQR